jgi:UDP-N-acetylmuramoylalanine--D-glutamate ligase
MNVKKVAVIGIGKTGLATAAFLSKRGIQVAITDEKNPSQWGEAGVFLKSLTTEVVIAPYGTAMLKDVDMVVPSPGVYPSNEILVEAIRLKIPVVSELELAFGHLSTPVVAITGTNGKTTTTSLIGEILRKSGKKVFVGGNIGDPLIGYADGPQEADWAIVEVSSFQLQWACDFHPAIALLLNVTPDHIDYHGSLASYREMKEKIFARLNGDDLAILNGDEEESIPLAARLKAQTFFFSASRTVAAGMFQEGERLVHLRRDGAREEYPVAMIKLPGKHNLENIMAAIMAARGCGCTPADILAAVSEFQGLRHRIEYVAEKNGVRFYDDSKGTNVGAVLRAVESFSEPLILLLGGRDKEGDFQSLLPLLRSKVKHLVLFGEAREKIDGFIGGTVRTTVRETLKEALHAAYAEASPGDVALLSPGCSSFDEFRNYKERGDLFQEWVKQL